MMFIRKSLKKRKTPTQKNAQFLEDIMGAIIEIIAAKQGKIKLQSARDFLNEFESINAKS